MTMMETYPEVANPPDEYLAEEIAARGLSQKELARRMGPPVNAVNAKEAIIAQTALQLEAAMPEIHRRLIAENGLDALRTDPHLRAGLNVYKGHVTEPNVAAALGRRHTTGFSIAGVPPVAHATTLPMAIDAALTRFEVVYAAAGHPHCVFATSAEELARLTGAPVVEGLGI